MITDYINLFLYQHVFFYRYIVDFVWPLGQILLIFLWILLIKYKRISGQKTALFGCILGGIMIVCNIFGYDIMAGKIAEYVFILFVISFIQEFYHFIKYENK